MRWEEHLSDLTPVERRGEWLYKREDRFAPLGYGGINGSKLRQCIYLIDRYTREGAGAGVLTGASVRSPQVSMAALVARHFGLPCKIVLGATNPTSAVRHENVAIARAAGAEFLYTQVAYNPALQRAVTKALAEHEGWYRLWYGIATPDGAGPEEVEAFHAIGAAQVENVPPETTTIAMTAGSCFSCVSVMYGLALHRPPALRRLVLLGIGPTRLTFIRRRLEQIEEATGTQIVGQFSPLFWDQRGLHHLFPYGGPITLEHHDLHATKYASYDDRQPWRQDGIEFHPTYEGKAMTYMHHRPHRFRWMGEPDKLFWIVGSEPTRAAMSRHLAR